MIHSWWCDDWISLTYGESLTHRLSKQQVLVRHFIGAGQGGHQAETKTARYKVTFAERESLWPAVKEGREKVAAWMREHGLARRTWPPDVATPRDELM